MCSRRRLRGLLTYLPEKEDVSALFLSFSWRVASTEHRRVERARRDKEREEGSRNFHLGPTTFYSADLVSRADVIQVFSRAPASVLDTVYHAPCVSRVDLRVPIAVVTLRCPLV